MQTLRKAHAVCSSTARTLLEPNIADAAPWLQEGTALGSSLRCHYQIDEYPEMHCTGTNLVLDLRKFEVRQQMHS